MKYLSFLIVLLTTSALAQIPEKPEDISPLLIGEIFPESSVQNIDGKEIAISSVLDNKKTILIFYRGSWCPYCNLHLAEVGKIENDLLALGYQVIAISPDAPQNLKKSVEKNKLSYTLLSDKNGTLAKTAGLAFKAPERHNESLKENQEGNTVYVLPVPALFILNEKREILFEYINPNYKNRISGELLLAAARIYSQKK